MSVHRTSPRPSSIHHHPSSRRSSNGLQLQDISHLPIVYPSSSPSPTNSQQDRRRTHADGQYVDKHAARDADAVADATDAVDDEEDDWELDREYIDLGAADAYGGYGPVRRPTPVHRDSQDVEFGNRLTSMRNLRGRGHHWHGRGMHVRLPHMKGLQRGKTALIKTFRRAQAGMMAGHHHSSSSSGHSPPPFEFRDPQPAPQSIRRQYAELAPSDPAPPAQRESTGMRTENGLLAPPVPVNGPNPSQLAVSERRASLPAADADSNSVRRHYRSRSDSHPSQLHRESMHTVRPRSKSVASRRSARSADTVVGGRSSQMHGGRRVEDDEYDEDDTAEATLVQHVNDLTLTPIHHSPSSSKHSKHSKVSVHPHSSHLSHHRHSRTDMRVPRPLAISRHGHHPRSRFGLRSYTSKTKSSFARAIKAFNRLPWMAAPVDPPGALIPTDYYPTPRIAKDFVPALSDRAKLRARVAANPAEGIVYKKEGVSARELQVEEDINGGSWYRPSTRQVQRAVRREQYAEDQLRAVSGWGMPGGMGMGGIARPVKQAYASYRAVAGRAGRPLDYMYAPSSGSRTPRSVAPSLYSSRHHSGHGHSHSHNHSHGHHDRSANTSSGSMIPRPRGIEHEVGAALYGLESRPGSLAAAASAYLTRSASTSTAQASQNARSPPHLRQISSGDGKKSAESASTVTPTVPSKNSEGTGAQLSRSLSQPQQQGQQQMAYAYAYPTGQSQAQTKGGQPIQYYAYRYAYPGAQSQPQPQRSRAPGSSPALPPIPVAPSSSYTSGSIPTIPTAVAPSGSAATQSQSQSQSSTGSSYSYTRPHKHHSSSGHRTQHRREYSQHGHEDYDDYRDRAQHESHPGVREARDGYGPRPSRYTAQRSGSGSSSDSGYGTVLGHYPHPHSRSHHGMPVSMRHAEYAYPSTYVR